MLSTGGTGHLANDVLDTGMTLDSEYDQIAHQADGEGLPEPPPYTPVSVPISVPGVMAMGEGDEGGEEGRYGYGDEDEDIVGGIRASWGGASTITGSRIASTPRSHPSSRTHASTSIHPRATQVRSKSSKSASNSSLRHRLFAIAGGVSVKSDSEGEWERDGERVICTAPGKACAGETETETDEPSRHLPTARATRTSSSLANSFSFPSSTSPFPGLPWQRLLFEFSRLLAIVPASLGFIWCLWHVYMYAPDHDVCRSARGRGRVPPDRIDYFVASLWALLTAHQCLSLTTGLLTRWRHYYPPLSTLVRLLALQGICWPATHLTLNILEVGKRPTAVWAVIGTTTCMSRSVQIWVISNLPAAPGSSSVVGSSANGSIGNGGERDREKRRNGYGYVYWRKWNKWRRRRRWDWKEVSLKCVLPAGVLYFAMAWAGELRRELSVC